MHSLNSIVIEGKITHVGSTVESLAQHKDKRVLVFDLTLDCTVYDDPENPVIKPVLVPAVAKGRTASFVLNVALHTHVRIVGRLAVYKGSLSILAEHIETFKGKIF